MICQAFPVQLGLGGHGHLLEMITTMYEINITYRTCITISYN